jgi:hypothetical protein
MGDLGRDLEKEMVSDLAGLARLIILTRHYAFCEEVAWYCGSLSKLAGTATADAE